MGSYHHDIPLARATDRFASGERTGFISSINTQDFHACTPESDYYTGLLYHHKIFDKPGRYKE